MAVFQQLYKDIPVTNSVQANSEQITYYAVVIVLGRFIRVATTYYRTEQLE